MVASGRVIAWVLALAVAPSVCTAQAVGPPDAVQGEHALPDAVTHDSVSSLMTNTTPAPAAGGGLEGESQNTTNQTAEVVGQEGPVGTESATAADGVHDAIGKVQQMVLWDVYSLPEQRERFTGADIEVPSPNNKTDAQMAPTTPAQEDVQVKPLARSDASAHPAPRSAQPTPRSDPDPDPLPAPPAPPPTDLHPNTNVVHDIDGTDLVFHPLTILVTSIGLAALLYSRPITWMGRRLRGILSPVIGLFVRLKDDSIKNKNSSRRLILQYIQENPGLCMRQVSAGTDVSYSTVKYHIKVLEYHDAITSRQIGNRRYLFSRTAGQQAPRKMDIHTVLGNKPLNRSLLSYVQCNPGVIQKQICEDFGISASNAHKHLKTLVEVEAVRSMRHGRTVRYYSLRGSKD